MRDVAHGIISLSRKPAPSLSACQPCQSDLVDNFQFPAQQPSGDGANADRMSKASVTKNSSAPGVCPGFPKDGHAWVISDETTGLGRSGAAVASWPVEIPGGQISEPLRRTRPSQGPFGLMRHQSDLMTAQTG